jgi:transcriptional regulator with XRE-family HTH domain
VAGSGAALVGANLRRLRGAAGLSLAALAERSGVAKGTVSELERGQGNPTVETLFALAYALDATLADLVDDPGVPAPRVVRAVERPFLPGRPLDARLLHRSQQQRIVHEVYELVVHPGAAQHAEAHRPGTREHLYVIEGDLTGGPRSQPVELGASDYATYAADVPHLYSSREGARALLTMTIAADP